jgi:thiol:disulfide interchange protein DsbD
MLAKQNHQPVLIDFYADWCNSCVMMDRTVFSREDVRNALKKITVLRVDLTHNIEFDQTMLKRFNIVGPPAIIFFNTEGLLLTSPRIVGEVSADKFLAQLSKVI